ncbi:MAG TPA: hypothetical protein VJ813_17675 [Vicinamibacterales bacterium]|nr:hypothetical protein [Vicinamibacterales bacterium]
MKRALLAVLLLASVSCGDMTREGTASSYLIINSLEGASGAEPGEFGGDFGSDVVTVDSDTGASTIFADPGRVTFALGLKDPGPAGSPTTPSPNNFITVTRYRVRYIRTDGRNVQGVDVPYTFDGAFTVTVADTTTAGFTLVRSQAKLEPPLQSLRDNLVVLSMIAEVTFYGHDQTGREVSATGTIGIHFANHGDPD